MIHGQYIAEVLEYVPAPGQHTNLAPWGIPSSARSITGGITGSLSLGSFGGYVIFRFDHPVENHPDNPYGVDFTVFGNPLTNWSEPGIVSVMKDDNGNGLPDDTWYELAGSDYFFSTTIRNYSVRYENPDKDVAMDVPWYDNHSDSGFVYANSFYTQPYYPSADSFPSVGEENYTLKGTYIKSVIDTSNPVAFISCRRAFGYADNQPRGSAPYTLPDNPYTPETENSGGDAFDIDWAVDEEGNYVYLDQIDFVKVHTAVLANGGGLGEVSTEITGAVDVEPADTGPGVLDMIVIKELSEKLDTSVYQLEAFVFHGGRVQTGKRINWINNIPGVSVDEYNILTVTRSGELTLTAALVGKPGITASVSTVIPAGILSSDVYVKEETDYNLFPNPASVFIMISNVISAYVSIYDAIGNNIFNIENYTSGEKIDISGVSPGLYIIQIREKKKVHSLKCIKR